MVLVHLYHPVKKGSQCQHALSKRYQTNTPQKSILAALLNSTGNYTFKTRIMYLWMEQIKLDVAYIKPLCWLEFCTVLLCRKSDMLHRYTAQVLFCKERAK